MADQKTATRFLADVMNEERLLCPCKKAHKSAYLDVFGWDACAAEVAALAFAAASIVVVLLYAAAVGTYLLFACRMDAETNDKT